MDASADPIRFIRENLRAEPVPLIPEIRLYTAHSGSGLSRLGAAGDRRTAAPYWAFPWAGGIVLARFLLDRPGQVAGRRVLDLGAGSGLVAIAAALGAARHVVAADIDSFARVAIVANAALNDVAVEVVAGLETPPPDIDLVLAGDVFYDRGTGRRALAVLERCRAAGIEVLIGDPFRPHLPRSRLNLVAEALVPEMGSGSGAVRSGVFTLQLNQSSASGEEAVNQPSY